MNVGRLLWSFGQNILEIFSTIWTFMTSPIDIASLELFGITLIEGFSFTPILVSSGVVIAFITINLLKP